MGYTSDSARQQLVLFGSLSRWLATTGRASGELDAVAVAEFLAERRRIGYAQFCSLRALTPLLAWLGDAGVIPTSATPKTEPVTEVDVLLERYRRHLISERGMVAAAARGYVDLVRPLLVARSASGDVDLQGLTAADIEEFLLGSSARFAAKTMQRLVSALRSFLGFAYLVGVMDSSLAAVVPAVACHPARPPRFLSAADVQALLDSCDRTARDGCRDYAMMLAMVRLGLRAGEIAALRLEDIAWRAGEILVRGKGGRLDRLPLPVDVGQAIADWLRRGRPATASGRVVFTRVRAPHAGLTAGGVTQAVAAGSRRAGLPTMHAHRLRHSAATGMLTAGASLTEIGQVLRHGSQLSTSIYAKVDLARLAPLARPWPGSRR
ncbi:MAG TPA: tyrosine-type recombinase/integrase [Amycolatopsis sp.]|nr:tyrosine-type recombinase/integrase [Amycolatopsis sp.]